MSKADQQKRIVRDNQVHPTAMDFIFECYRRKINAVRCAYQLKQMESYFFDVVKEFNKKPHKTKLKEGKA